MKTRRSYSCLTSLPRCNKSTDLVLAFVWIAASASNILAQVPGQWVPVASPTRVSLRGVSAVSDRTVWAGGAEGTLLRSTDGGQSFTRLHIPGSEKMEFRDVEAIDDQTCSVMVAGQPARFYHTSDGGQNWTIAFEHPSDQAFFDAMAFWDDQRGIAFSDAVDGRLVIVSTENGGRTWTLHASNESPRVSADEHGYAASGTCLTVGENGQVWIGLGGPSSTGNSRVFYSADFGQHWQAATTTLAGSESAGVFSLHFLDSDRGVAVGGDYRETSSAQSVISVTEDGGKTWSTPKSHQLRGFRSCIVESRMGDKWLLLCCGPDGCDFSTDGGRRWQALAGDGYHAMDFAGTAGWAVGADGRIARWLVSDAVE